MDHISPVSRQQYEFVNLEDCINTDNPVRFVDAFVDKLDLHKLGFKIAKLNAEGRPSFKSGLFLKIYIYGYLNGIRSTRKLERECVRNIEMQWLCGRLKPNYHSIADFRKVNPNALRNTFKLFVSFLREADLVGGELIAIDGTKSRAHNSKKNNYNQKKVDRHLKYLEDRSKEYLKELDRCDSEEKDSERINGIQEKIKRLKEKEIKYHQIASQLEESGEVQVSTTDADARALLVHGQVVEVSYNTQAAVDEKHKLVVATHTINRNDRNAFSAVVKETQENLNKKTFIAIADKGYNNGREIEIAIKAGVTTIVALQEIVNSNEKGTTPDYLVTKFEYNKQEDTYTCPAGQVLKSTGTWHTKKRSEEFSFKFKKYRTPACKNCPVKHLCTARAEGREIERSEFAESTDLNAHNYTTQYDVYRKRQELNEHVFGTIKRVWGYYYTNLKGLKKVNGEMSLIMTVYNMKRTINILGFDKLMDKLRVWKPKYKKSWACKHFINAAGFIWTVLNPRMGFPCAHF